MRDFFLSPSPEQSARPHPPSTSSRSLVSQAPRRANSPTPFSVVSASCSSNIHDPVETTNAETAAEVAASAAAAAAAVAAGGSEGVGGPPAAAVTPAVGGCALPPATTNVAGGGSTFLCRLLLHPGRAFFQAVVTQFHGTASSSASNSRRVDFTSSLIREMPPRPPPGVDATVQPGTDKRTDVTKTSNVIISPYGHLDAVTTSCSTVNASTK